ncbi:Uncharacterised protein [Mycobacteroides abscessus subsp. abscessus]|nr:Uncharacterised protein [Mycobacteroides abscessus subsp. abscessus]
MRRNRISRDAVRGISGNLWATPIATSSMAASRALVITGGPGVSAIGIAENTSPFLGVSSWIVTSTGTPPDSVISTTVAEPDARRSGSPSPSPGGAGGS